MRHDTMKAFPLRFDFTPEVWCGARARLHSSREDAFQQLLGDALRISMPGFVATFSTAGRDGSIDAFIEASVPLPRLFGDVSSPIIVECKDNDDRSDDVVENVSSAWRKLAERLERKAADKWPDLYQPWITARGYIYATSATLPHKKARDDLRNKIHGFFDRLRISNLCGIEQVRVVDWTDLRHFYDTCPGLADRWLGVETGP